MLEEPVSLERVFARGDQVPTCRFGGPPAQQVAPTPGRFGPPVEEVDYDEMAGRG